MRRGACWLLFDGEVGIGDTAGARPASDVPSSLAGTGLISAFVKLQHRCARMGQRAHVIITQHRKMAAVALDPPAGEGCSGS